MTRKSFTSVNPCPALVPSFELKKERAKLLDFAQIEARVGFGPTSRLLTSTHAGNVDALSSGCLPNSCFRPSSAT